MQYALVVLWLLVFAGLAVLGFPLAARLFGAFESRGVGFALPVALLTMWLPVYFLGHLSFGPLTVALGLLVLLVAAALVGLDRDALRRRELRVADDLLGADPAGGDGVATDVIAENGGATGPTDDHPVTDRRFDRTAVVEVALVFVAAFVFLVAVRAVDPAVHAGGGEKYLDFGILKSLLRSPTLPPEDMWFAGEPLRYYYGGHLLAAILSTLTGTAPRFAYNLALAGFYAMLVTGAYDLAGSVAAVRGGSRRVAGLFAAFFVGFASNLATMGRVALGLLPAGVRAGLVGGDANVPYYSFSPGSEFYVEDVFSYWSASRVISTNSYTINEFPLFAWLNGDMHAHMMGTPFLLLAAAIGFALYLAPAAATRRRRGLLAVLPLLGVFQLVTDTWSLPSVFGITYLALVFSPAAPTTLLSDGGERRFRAATGRVVGAVAGRHGSAASGRHDGVDAESNRLVDELRRLLVPLGVVAVLAGATVVLGLPFLLGAGASRSVEFLPVDARSTLGELLVVHGAFVLLFGAYLFDRADESRRWPVVVGSLVVALVALSLSMDVLAITLPLLVVCWTVLRFDRPVGYEAVLVVAGAGLVTLVEFIFVVEEAGPLRMNTVFKTYMQVWVFWGTAAGAVVAGLVDRPFAARRPSGSSRDAFSGVPLPSVDAAVSVLLALVVLSTSVYGAFAMTAHFEATGPATLDATSFGPGYDQAEVEATEWLDGEATSETIIASAPAAGWYPEKRSGGHPPGMYDWRSSIAASLTGVPTVAGWAHEVGYRGSQEYYTRVADVDTLYTGSPAESAAVLRTYRVEYVWVGNAERARYGGDLADFENRDGYEVVFRNDAVTVYRVDESALPA